MSIATLAVHLRSLVEAHAVRSIRPTDKAAAQRYARLDARFRMLFPHVHTGRLDAIVDSHGALWAASGRTGAIRRAKRDAANKSARTAVCAMLAAMRIAPSNDTVASNVVSK
jgi:hypothetical protein